MFEFDVLLSSQQYLANLTECNIIFCERETSADLIYKYNYTRKTHSQLPIPHVQLSNLSVQQPSQCGAAAERRTRDQGSRVRNSLVPSGFSLRQGN